MMNNTRFDELKATDRLPSPTGVALAILKLTQKEGTKVQEIAKVLQADPALTGRILKIANSASQGASRPIATVQEAMVRLGIRMVRQLSLGFSVLNNCRSGTCKRFDYAAFWSRSLAMAVAAQIVSRRLKLAADESFTCGLLSQIGSLALASIYPDEYGEALVASPDPTSDEFVRLERERFATDHFELGAAILQDWGLPETCVEAVAQYRSLSDGAGVNKSKSQALAQVIRLAEKMAAVCVGNESGRNREVPQVAALAEHTGIAGDELPAVFDGVANEWREWGKTLNVTTQDVPPFADLVERSRQAQAVEAAAPSQPVAAAPTETEETATPGTKTLRVLILDHDTRSLDGMASQLKAAGHSLFTSGDGHDGLRILLESNPHLVLVSWDMPGLGGAELCRMLRQTEAGRDLYIVMLTDAEEEHWVASLDAGANDYLVKPFRPRMLAARVGACQRLVQLQEELERDREELRAVLADLAVANRQLQQTALTDALTSLPNRRYMIDRLNQEWSGSLRHDRPLSFMMLDIDHFKSVNDKHGHDVGDIVLKQTAAALRTSARRNDVVCRLGGEEFVVVCPDTDAAAVLQCAERLRQAVEANFIDTPGFERNVTVSIGVATRCEGIADPDALLKAADEALYCAKRGGRNRVCVAQSESTTGVSRVA
jgi:diguanylate cyclase (GGDEF)-like protein